MADRLQKLRLCSFPGDAHGTRILVDIEPDKEYADSRDGGTFQGVIVHISRPCGSALLAPQPTTIARRHPSSPSGFA